MKQIKIEDDNWLKLWNLKLELKARRMDDVISYLLAKKKEE